MKNAFSRATKKILAAVLSITMLLSAFPTAAIAAGSDANVESSITELMNNNDRPREMDTIGDPYGEAGAFSLASQHELMYIYSDAKSSMARFSENVDIGTDTVNAQSWAGDPVAMAIDPVKNWTFLEAVAFDPYNSERDTHLAFVGYCSDDKALKVGVSEISLGKDAPGATSFASAQTVTRWVGEAKWMSEADGHTLMHFSAPNFLDITAGDYDGDGKETIVVFGSTDGKTAALSEWYLSADGGTLYQQATSNSLLHWSYQKQGFGDTDDAGMKLQADLTTGDFDGDKRDDLAVVSYFGASFNKDMGDSSEIYSPYLGIAMGCGGGSHIVSKSSNNCELPVKKDEYSENMTLTMASPSVAAGDVDGDGIDEVMVAGYGLDVKYNSDGTYKTSNLSSASVVLAGYNVSVNKKTTNAVNFIFSQELADNDSEIINEMTEGIIDVFSISDDLLMVVPQVMALPQFALECVATNGRSLGEDLFVNGSFVRYSRGGGGLELIYQDGFFGKRDTGAGEMVVVFSYLTNLSVGTFDDNLVGREQIAYTVYQKDGQGNIFGTTNNADDYSVMLGISGGTSYDDTVDSKTGEILVAGEVESYNTSGLDDGGNGYSSGPSNRENYEFDDVGFDINDEPKKNLLFVAVDIDEDGIVAIYNSKDYKYSDMNVIAVLQAAPYYKEFGYPENTQTVYSFTSKYTVGQTDSSSTSFSVGANVEAKAGCIKSSISTGYSEGWSQTFTSSFDTEYTTSFTATRDNAVVMQRTPVILYKYLIQGEDGEFSDDNYITIAMPCEPVYALSSVEDYNDYVTSEKYTDDFDEDSQSEMLLNAGDPLDYRDHWTENATVFSKGNLEAGIGTGVISSQSGSGSSTTTEQSTSSGFYFNSCLSVGGEVPLIGVEAWAGVEMSTDSTRTQGSFVTTANSTSVEGRVANLGETGLPAEILKDHVFNWQFGCWPLYLGVSDVYVYGYMVSPSGDSGVKQVTDLEVSDGSGEAESAVLEWTAVDDADGYNVYLYEDGEYTLCDTVDTNTYEYTIDPTNRRTSFTFAVTAVLGSSETVYSNHATYYRQAHGLSAYELAVLNGFDGTVKEWIASLAGKDGEDGIGIKEIYLDTDGNLIVKLSDNSSFNLGSVTGEDGEDGLTPYINSEDGCWWIGENSTGIKATGEKGDTGVGVSGTEIDESGNLIITLTDGSRHNLGKVTGDSGEDGQDGADGKNGKDGKDGADGKDGVGIKNMKFGSDGNLIVTLTDGTELDLESIVQPARTGNSGGISRLSGGSRYTTAVAISREGWSKADTVIIASGENYPDALAGVSISRKLDAPVLLTEKAVLNADTLNEIHRLGAKNVIILGGTSAVSKNVETTLAKHASVERISGDNRNGTAAAIAARVTNKSDAVFLVSNRNFADALAASSPAAIMGTPILYLNPDGTVPTETAAALRSLGCKKSYIIGGAAAIGNSAEINLKALGITVERVYGGDRCKTSAAIYTRFSSVFTSDGAAFATGKNYPDALTGAALSAKYSMPVFMAGDSIPVDMLNALSGLQANASYIFGGENAVSSVVANALAYALE